MFALRVIHRGSLGLYRKARLWRERVLTKIESLQAESQRWRLAFSTLKLPYTLLIAMGFSPRTAVTLIIAGSTVGGGVVVNETVLSGYSFSRGDPGIYLAPSDNPIVYSNDNNTLRVDLGSTPVGEIIIEDVTVGSVLTGSTVPSGTAEVVIIGGSSSAGTYIEVGHLTIDRWRCTQLTLQNIEVHELNVRFNASDGQSFAPVAGTPRARGIGGGNRADQMITSGGTYDLIKIRAPTSGVNGQVDVLTMTNIYTKGGTCVIDRVKAGIIDVIFNEVGNGDGFDDKDFIIADTVIYQTFNSEDNVEVAISPP